MELDASQRWAHSKDDLADRIELAVQVKWEGDWRSTFDPVSTFDLPDASWLGVERHFQTGGN